MDLQERAVGIHDDRSAEGKLRSLGQAHSRAHVGRLCARLDLDADEPGLAGIRRSCADPKRLEPDPELAHEGFRGYTLRHETRFMKRSAARATFAEGGFDEAARAGLLIDLESILAFAESEKAAAR